MANAAGSATIDRESYEPAYAQLVRILSEEIAGGRYRPGDQLPSESQLCARFDVSGMTVRRAINILVDRGIVNASQGKGTFVRGLDMREAAFRLRERPLGAAPGLNAQVRLIQAVILPSDERVARKLDIAGGSKVIYLRRLVYRPDGPVMYHREYMIYDPRRPTVEAELQITSLEGLFRGQPFLPGSTWDAAAGTPGAPAQAAGRPASPDRQLRGDGPGLRRGDLSMEAVVVNSEEAEVLQVPAGSPGLCLEHIFYDFENRPVAWGWFICRADRFSLISHIGPDVA